VKIPYPSFDLDTSLREFDIWITPSLGEIRDTEKYQEELELLVSGFELLRQVTADFTDETFCQPAQIVPALQQMLSKLSPDEAKSLLDTVALVLYLVTGKSDNNVKCQLPLFLRDQAGLATLPVSRKKGLETIPLPRVLKASRLMRIAAGLNNYPDQQATLLLRFIEFILSDELYISQFWSIGHSYVALAEIGKGADLLSPLAVFKVRGSVSATGGHDPENILRDRLVEWGLQPGIDFNETDVTLDQVFPDLDVASGPHQKTRAYDFVLPFKSWESGSKVLVQSQFYAGDSGSVSHKNVDQTRSSRDSTKAIFPEAIFVEYVDGAGYFASLNGDLRSLLAMSDTISFFQLRSAPVRLRRELQAIGFLTPLEIEHAVLQVGPDQADVYGLLVSNGYDDIEIDRCLSQAFDQGILIRQSDTEIGIRPDRRPLARVHLLLDIVAIHGEPLDVADLSGKLLIPGYGPFFGLRQNDLIRLAKAEAPAMAEDWQETEVAFDDLQWLLDQRFITSGQ